MRNLHVALLIAGLALVVPHTAVAQDEDRQASGSGSGSGASTATATTDTGKTYTVTQKPKAEQPEPPPGRWVRALTNVQVDLTITDQTGTGTPEKKSVTMVVSSGSWGKIRSAGMVKPGPDSGPTVVELNVDARPFVSVDGPIQMELTLVYRPLGAATDDMARGRPLPLNQSLTVVLQSGKPLVVSQAADPLNDRKIGVEVTATVLK
jgi:hypothetical protein